MHRMKTFLSLRVGRREGFFVLSPDLAPFVSLAPGPSDEDRLHPGLHDVQGRQRLREAL